MATEGENAEKDQNFRAGELFGAPTPIYDSNGRQVGISWRNLHLGSRRPQSTLGTDSKPQPKKAS